MFKQEIALKVNHYQYELNLLTKHSIHQSIFSFRATSWSTLICLAIVCNMIFDLMDEV